MNKVSMNKVKEAQNVECKWTTVKRSWLKGTEHLCGWAVEH